MNYEIILISPTYAQHLLTKNISNRPISKRTVERYALEMQENKWITNGDTIKISTSGKLIDGQHRLMAIVSTGLSIVMGVCHNVPDNAFVTYDKGKRRGHADDLAIAGFTYRNHAAAINRIYYSWSICDDKKNFYANYGRQKVTDQMLLDYAKQKKTILDEALLIGIQLKNITSITIVGVAYSILQEIDKSEAEVFFEIINDGIFREKYDPMKMLRDRLLRSPVSSFKEQTMILALIFKAWNLSKKGKKVKSLVWNRCQSHQDNFPVPIK